MEYITAAYYSDEYRGVPVGDPLQLGRLIERATETVDSLTNYQVQQIGIDRFPPFIQTQIKKAVAAQVEFLADRGETAGSFSEAPKQVSIGSFGYTAAGENGSASSRFASGMIDHLLATGLLYAGLD